jgi:hypothetical protein
MASECDRVYALSVRAASSLATAICPFIVSMLARELSYVAHDDFRHARKGNLNDYLAVAPHFDVGSFSVGDFLTPQLR